MIAVVVEESLEVVAIIMAKGEHRQKALDQLLLVQAADSAQSRS